MLKLFLGFLVSVVVLQSSAYAFTAHATSANVLITHIQAGGVGTATQEFIVIYNNSAIEVDITGWCLTNKNNVSVACFSVGVAQEMYLPAYAHATAVSSTLVGSVPAGTATVTFTPISQSSGSITGGGDTLSLLDHTGALVDRQSWTSSLAGGTQYERRGSGMPVLYQDTDAAADWIVTTPTGLPLNESVIDTTIVDVCLNIAGDQLLVPVGKELNSAGECVDQIIIQLEITEILPNAIGSDVGNEFIELNNPNDFAVHLADYILYVGPELANSYTFAADLVIEAHGYKSVTNSEIDFSLLNTSSKVLLALKNGIVVSEVLPYQSPKEGRSWAFIDGMWQYTDYPTPGRENVFLIDEILLDAESTAKPCAANQYRSLETNRCRLLSTPGTVVTPCKDGQYRSEETNRCRNIASDAKTVTPCAEGQERNVETNRCRKIVTATMPAACKEGQERNPETNRCRNITKMTSAGYGVVNAAADNPAEGYVFAAVGGVLLLALGYAVWEWHDELGKYLRKSYSWAMQFVRTGK